MTKDNNQSNDSTRPPSPSAIHTSFSNPNIQNEQHEPEEIGLWEQFAQFWNQPKRKFNGPRLTPSALKSKLCNETGSTRFY